MSVQINNTIRLELAGENALMLYFISRESINASSKKHPNTDLNNHLVTSTEINEEVSSNVQHATQLIRHYLSDDIIDLIPSYASIMVMFDLQRIDHHRLRNKLRETLIDCGKSKQKSGTQIELPVYYSLESGQDLSRIAQHANISIEEVINIHRGQVYRVYAIGFAPGFAYLGEVDERIAMPRLATPRLKVPRGAVAIADRQTAIYPSQSPGGWNIIGLCPIDMFNPLSENIMPISVGDVVKFVAINKQQYIELGGVLPCSIEAR